MHKVSFEQVALLDNEIFLRAYNIEATIKRYIDMLHYCGWTKQEYETELLKRIDRDW